jgi:capsular exopolysaccharide synthesis family protein
MRHLFPTFYSVLWNIRSAEGAGKRNREVCDVIAFASANHGEGTSTLALNFSFAFAGNSLDEIVLIDGNLRTPSLHKEFGVGRDGGFTELLQGDRSIDDVMYKFASSRLCFISAGAAVDNPILLYESASCARVLGELKNRFKVIIFDLAPIIKYPEILVLSSKMDGLILVIEAENTKWEVARYAKSCLERANVTILGAILNKRELFIPDLIYKML